MYISWQVLNAFYKGKATPTTDNGWMYTARGTSGGFHVKWHKIKQETPAVDRFHVTFESNGKKAYYKITTSGYEYLGARPDSGVITRDTAAKYVGNKLITEYETIAAGFLRSVNQNLKAKLRLELDEAVSDDKEVDLAIKAQKARAEIIGELRTKYNSFTEEQFVKAGLTKLRVSQRFGPEWTPEYYEQIISKLEVATGTTVPTVTETPSTKVPLPMPKDMTVDHGPVTTYKPVDKSGVTPTTSKWNGSK